jgi:hypothetical protein
VVTQTQCGGHGACNSTNLQCTCDQGFLPPDCTQLACASPCINGKCTNGTCSCDKGWNGDTCNFRSCGVNDTCSSHGTCDQTTFSCTCDAGFNGATCEFADCGKGPNGKVCSGRGTCDAKSARYLCVHALFCVPFQSGTLLCVMPQGVCGSLLACGSSTLSLTSLNPNEWQL